MAGTDILDKPCPKCKQLEVTYSGNYYCTNPDCNWGLPEGGHVQPWLESLIRARKAAGRDTTYEESYLTKNKGPPTSGWTRSTK